VTIDMLKQQRQTSDLTAEVVAKRALINCSRYSSLERGLIAPKPGELQRIHEAIVELASARQRVRDFVLQNNLPMEVLV
jgi:predicted transcriptional regulator